MVEILVVVKVKEILQEMFKSRIMGCLNSSRKRCLRVGKPQLLTRTNRRDRECVFSFAET